jgi:predicted amidohydrolase
MDVPQGRPERNLSRAREFAAGAAEAGADLLLLPELWLHGYDLENGENWAAPLGEGGFAEMASMAADHGLHVAGSILERHEDGISNTAVLYGPEGDLLGSYRKMHLFRLMQEHTYLTPGTHATLCQTEWGATGLGICYDLRFPELFRTMALAGAQLFVVPAQWPVKRVEAWLLLARARAAENELIVAACNRVGNDGDVSFPGRSIVADPWGNTVVEGDNQERLLIARVDLREIEKTRRYLTVYKDRRPGAYVVK